MKIATWNINGVKARIESAVTWLKEAEPDVACFQEIKSVTEAFPAEPFEELGYNLAVHGQKGFNGVAILSKRPFDEIAVRGLPGDDSDAPACRGLASTPSGTTRPAPGRRTTASASTISWPHPRPPTGWCRPPSTSTPAAGKSRRIMCRCGLN